MLIVRGYCCNFKSWWIIMIEVPVEVVLDILTDLKHHEKLMRMELPTRTKLYDLLQEYIERRR